MPIDSPDHSATPLWRYNATLLRQIHTLIEQLQYEALPGFVYAQAIGPHTRHIIEHYQALLRALEQPETSVDYDARERDLRLQTDPAATQAALLQLIDTMSMPSAKLCLDLQTPLATRLQAGVNGELELQVATSLGRELLFVASHTVHHYALIGHYSRAAGVDPGPDFGKAPATVAFEQARATATAVATA